MSKFVHLHVHTEYSLLDGLSNISKLFTHIKENNMDSVAITDHGVMYGAIDFYKEGKKQGVKPIIGMEGYMTSSMKEKVKDNYHILLLAKNLEGYKNLMKLTSMAHVEGFYYKPRFDKETLKKYSKGIICTSACPKGEIGQSLINDDYKSAKNVTQWFLDVFDKDYYLEVQKHNYEKILPDVKDIDLKRILIDVNNQGVKHFDGIIKLSRELGIPLVATNDAHYIKKEDAEAQDALVCIATGKNVADIKRLRYIDNPDFYLKSPDEMGEMFKDYPEAIANTVKIANKCELEIVLGKWFFPKFPLPIGMTDNDYLRNLSREKLLEKIPKAADLENERLEHELKIICDKGYAPYFLIAFDMVTWANLRGIVTNTRGSAAGSLVSYALGITTVNPLKYYLPFERFLNPFRPSPPDIDFDVADDRRSEIIGYITQKYGHEKVAQVCTFGRMLSRAAVRDIARVLGFPYSVGDKIAKLIPAPKQGFPITIPKALEEVRELKELYDSDSDTKKVIDLAVQVEGNVRHISVHAAGVVIAPENIIDLTPIQLEPSGDKIISQYEMHACEDVGLIKFDILGIRNLSILGAAIKIVKNSKGIDINLVSIPLDNKKTYEMLARGETMGVFQLGGSSGMTKYIKELKPTKVTDLMAMVALYRPGPISVIPEYIERKRNPKLIKYLDPRMEKFLKASYGLIVYQDDLLFCALDLAGYTWEEADKFRKAVGKKIPAEMAAQRTKFEEGIIKNGQTKEFAENLWKLFEPFQSYGFNKAHAASYGIVAYQTAYMKANYPVEYMTALLTAESSDIDKISLAINECRRMKIKVMPPDINESGVDFVNTGDVIRFGLSAIKNVGKAAIEAILEARKSGVFTSFSDFIEKADARRVNKKVVESLIKVGALSSFGNRASLLGGLSSARSRTSKRGEENQQILFESAPVDLQIMNVDEFSDSDIESLERQLLGFSLSAKPVSEVIGVLEHMASHKIFELASIEAFNEQVKIAAVVSEVRVIVTRNSASEMAFVRVEDESGSIEVVVFPKIYKSTKNHWQAGKAMLIYGHITTRGESTSLIVDSIDTSTGSIDKGEVYIKAPDNVNANALKALKALLQENLGGQDAYLVLDKKNIKLPMKIDWNETLGKQILVLFEDKN
ncbi:MAG: DNA polymerase III subunit alpha [Patescibacteria group bacterium]